MKIRMNRRDVGSALSRAGVGLAACLLYLTMGAAPAAQAGFEFSEFNGAWSIEGKFTRQAGAHPDFTTTLKFNETGARNAVVDLPPGLTVNPTAAPTCTAAQLVGESNGKLANCPVDSQVGFAEVFGAFPVPIYNMERPVDLPGLLAFNASGVVIKIKPRVRVSDYGIKSTVNSISQALQITGSRITLWGVPSDPFHDPQRYFKGGQMGGGASSGSPPLPFVSTPTSCAGAPLVTTGEADSWWEPGVFSRASFDSDADGTPFMVGGCGRLAFDPAISVTPDSHGADAPVGLNFSLAVPQSDSPYGLAVAHVREVRVTFPPGFAVSPAAAQGLDACRSDQIKLGSEELPDCPPGSVIGSVAIDTPLLDEELEGDVVVARQADNPFASLLALYVVVEGPGVLLKLPGRVDLDPRTGQLTATFSGAPQLPFERFRLSLRGGPDAPLVTPHACGTYSTQVEITSWASSTPVPLSSPMTIDDGCATGGFSPKLSAGTVSPIAGKSSPFTLQVTRQDGEQNVAGIDATLPEGVLAKLAGVPLCGDAAAATGNCPASSQVGTTTVGIGAGSNPIYVPEAGKAPTAVYLGGPYRGAPYSLVVKVPAQAGPFDLGTVVVRNALYIDPVTTRVTAKSDPLPQILEGIPIAYRDVRVEVNRPDFTLNPTSCDSMKVNATIVSSGGKSASPSAPFQVANCERLGFQPKLTLSLSGKTHRSAHPKLRAVLTARKGDANIGRAQVTLPKTEFLENAHIQTICTRVQFAADNCPAKSIYGYAKAWSPLLDKPIQGPVYLRSSNHELPDLVASLDGQIHVDLQGRIDSVRSRIRNTFDFVPDAPVSKFVLTMQGGKKGLLVNNTELCKAVPRAQVALDGQNGKTSDSSPVVKTDCGKSRKKK